MRPLRSAGDTILSCQRSIADPSYARFPQLPVVECSGYDRSPYAGLNPVR